MPFVPRKVAQNANLGLNLRKLYRRGGTEVGISTARKLVRAFVNGKEISPKFVRKISQYFPRHAGDRLDRVNPPSNGLIAWLLWGGTEGWNWSKKEIQKSEKKYA